MVIWVSVEIWVWWPPGVPLWRGEWPRLDILTVWELQPANWHWEQETTLHTWHQPPSRDQDQLLRSLRIICGTRQHSGQSQYLTLNSEDLQLNITYSENDCKKFHDFQSNTWYTHVWVWRDILCFSCLTSYSSGDGEHHQGSLKPFKSLNDSGTSGIPNETLKMFMTLKCWFEDRNRNNLKKFQIKNV